MILVTGGAGYIGTNLILELINMTDKIVVVDDFVNAKEKYIESLKEKYEDKIVFYKVDVCDEQSLDNVFKMYKFDGVIHLASKKYVDDSIKYSNEYLTNNIESTKVLLKCMGKYNVKKLLFASSVVVYGNLQAALANESHSLNPLSPYAVSKKVCEDLINEWGKKDNVAIVCRFSNPAGANIIHRLGDDPKSNKKNLIPYISDKIKKGEKLIFNGNDHPTRDGTPIRDYIHVSDLVSIVATLYTSINKSVTCNIVRKEGYTVLEVLKEFESAFNKKIEYDFNPKREGEIAVISYSNELLKSLINFEYKKDLTDIVKSQIEFDKYN